jgi:ParB family transcriptional regulator, chromosome partitioning protein
MPAGTKDGSKKAAARKPRRSRKRAEPASRGLGPADVAAADASPEVRALAKRIGDDGGAVLATYRDPLGGHWQVLAALPLERVEPTPYQRDLSETHVDKLSAAIDRLGRFLDPIVAVRTDAGTYQTPNGRHRLASLQRLGARAVVAIVVPEAEMAFQILTLNTEKAHNLRERALEVIRMARELARIDDRPEAEYGTIFEEPALLTLGLCYEERGRFSGGAYHPVLKRCEAFLDLPLSAALAERERRRAKVFALDDAVTACIAALKARGFESPYLRNYVLARVNPLRFQRGATAEFDATLDKMQGAAERFDTSKVKADQVASAGGPPEDAG